MNTDGGSARLSLNLLKKHCQLKGHCLQLFPFSFLKHNNVFIYRGMGTRGTWNAAMPFAILPVTINVFQMTENLRIFFFKC